MSPKQHTVILVPHGRARFRKWNISNRQLLVGGFTIVSLLALSLVSLFSFFTKAVDKQQLAELGEENRQLREVNQEFENSLRELKNQLTEFEQRTDQLAIVAGLDPVDPALEVGVGGGELETRSDGLAEHLDRIEASLEERSRRAAATPTISPVRGILTSGFGYREDPLKGGQDLHRAIDLSAAPGQPVLATADGIVVRAERSGNLGNAVVIAHGFGFTTRYGHLARFKVNAGQRVKRGDVVGFVGNTGRTTGYHLHYEVLADGSAVNPLHYILDSTPRTF